MHHILLKRKRLQVAKEGGTVEIRSSDRVPGCWRGHGKGTTTDDHTCSAGTLGRRASCGWLNGDAVVQRLERPTKVQEEKKKKKQFEQRKRTGRVVC